MLNFNVFGGGGGRGQVWGAGVGGRGLFLCCCFNAIFFELRAKHQIIFLPNKQNLEEYFNRQHF